MSTLFKGEIVKVLCQEFGSDDRYNDGIRKAIQIVWDIDASDIQHVVRCKDCTKWGCGVRQLQSDHAKVCMAAGWMTGANGYCLYAQKKE